MDLKNSVLVTEVPESFLKMYRKYYKSIIDDDNFGELLCHRTASPVLQVLVITLQKISAEKFASVTELIAKKARIEMKPADRDGDSESDTDNEEEEEDEETFHKYVIFHVFHKKLQRYYVN